MVGKQNKASKRKQRKYFHDLGVGKYFSNKAQKAQTTNYVINWIM